jgi:gamma-glutamyltranspeptidase/glutathione hydrolase
LPPDRDEPAAARAALGRTVEMLALLHGYFGRTPLAELVRAGRSVAKSQGAAARERLLERIGAQGVTGVRSDAVVAALVAAAGPVAGGVLTPDDVGGARPADAAAAALPCESGGAAYVAPWNGAAGAGAPLETIAVADARGAVGALAYEPAAEGVDVPALEVRIPRVGVPVRRGVARVRPGTALPMRAPIALVSRAAYWVAIGIAGAREPSAAELCAIAGALSFESALQSLREATASRQVVAAMIEGREARVVTA